jgi:hypothetical protein
VKGVEEKLDDTTRQLALLQRASSGNQDAERFQQAFSTAVLGAAPLLERQNWLGAISHIVPVVQNVRGFGSAMATKPISTFAFPLVAAAAYASRKPRPPVIIASTDRTASAVRVTIMSPDGGEVYYELDGAAKGVTKSSTRYTDPIVIGAGLTRTLRARTYVFLRGSEPAQQAFIP